MSSLVRHEPGGRWHGTAALGSRLRSEGGQSSVELVALLPLVLLIGLGLATILDARSAEGQAAAAAQAGAMALITDADPAEAAHASLPVKVRERATVRVTGRSVTVVVRPPTRLRFLGDVLVATASAHAGSEAAR